MEVSELSTSESDGDLRLVTIPDAAAYLAVSRGALYTLMASGAVASRHIGRARRIPLAELQGFVRRSMRR